MTESNLQEANNQYNIILTTVIGQVGCITPLILLAALFAGLWLDRLFETRPFFTILAVVGSAPVSLFVLYRIVKSATGRLRVTNQPAKTKEEEVNRE